MQDKTEENEGGVDDQQNYLYTEYLYNVVCDEDVIRRHPCYQGHGETNDCCSRISQEQLYAWDD